MDRSGSRLHSPARLRPRKANRVTSTAHINRGAGGRDPAGPAIRVADVRKHFGDVEALAGVDLEVEHGSVLGLLGPNGAGKTTLVRILTTLLRPDGGSATVAGLDVVRDAEALRSVIGLAGQSAAIDEYLTGRENLEMVARLYHLPRDESRRRASELLERFDLVDAADRMARNYSGGMRRRLDLAASLIAHPPVLFLDEPTSGLDPRSRIQMWEVIRGLVDEGTTVLLTTQYLEEADELADRITVIDRGRVIAEGTSDELKARSASAVLTLQVAQPEQVPAARDVLARLGDDEPQVNGDDRRLSVAVAGGTMVLAQAVRELDAAGVELTDIGLRHPTLDDVFLALTGHRAEDPGAAGVASAGDGNADNEAPAARGRRRGRGGR